MKIENITYNKSINNNKNKSTVDFNYKIKTYNRNIKFQRIFK